MSTREGTIEITSYSVAWAEAIHAALTAQEGVPVVYGPVSVAQAFRDRSDALAYADAKGLYPVERFVREMPNGFFEVEADRNALLCSLAAMRGVLQKRQTEVERILAKLR